MKELFDGLDELGFDTLEDIEVFKEDEKSPAGEMTITSSVVSVEDCIFEKSFQCPCCDKKFKAPLVKTSKAKFHDIDSDLMPIFTPVYPFFYNIAICPDCGFAAISENFSKMTHSQCQLIKKSITPKYKHKRYTIPFSEDIAIEQYKYALLNSVIKKGRVSEKAYICLVISWLYKLKGDEENRMLFLRNAYQAFVDSYSKETFPLYGMNECVMAYLLAELARLVGDGDESLRWCAQVFSSKLATQKIKDLTLEVKNKVNKSKALNQQKAPEPTNPS